MVVVIGLIYIIYKVNKTELKKYIYPECFYPKVSLLKDIVRQATPATGSMVFIGFGIFVLLYYVSLYGDYSCLLYTSPSPRDATLSRMPSSA